jgi:phosphatidylethanolamine/phosphatidyl-N-methylethanolamine N-methyltransferase
MRNGNRDFLAQFIRNPHTVGAVLPSSKALARAMLEPVDFDTLSTIVEFGPGIGAITQEILQRLSGNQRYFGFEINPNFLQQLRQRFPNQTFIGKPASEIAQVLRASQIETIDAVICGLPWASLPISEQSKTLEATISCLKPGGRFITFAYLQGLILPAARALRRRLNENFSTVSRTRIVWQNIPPAFAYVCVK